MRMRCHLLTKNLFCSLFCFGLLSASGVAFAQVYKSYDADGNVVFSDTPSKRSKEVEVSKPNVSDSFEVPPRSSTKSTFETEPETKTKPEQATQPIADNDPADTNNDGRVSRREKEEQREERHRKNREAAEAAEGDKE
jgi:hypothetical protein